MLYYILPLSSVPIARSTVQPISKEEQMTEVFIKALHELDKELQERFAER